MQWARTGHLGLSLLFALGLAVQFFLAGAGAFGAESYDPHSGLGSALVVVSLVLLVLALLGRSSIKVTLALFLLMVLQLFLAGFGREDEPWLGALHGLNALVIAGVVSALVHRSMAERRRPEAHSS